MIAINDAGPTVPAEGAEASRRRELGRLARAFEHLPVGMALQTPEGRWIDVNPEFCRMVGYSREVLLSLSFTDITDREDLQPSLDRLERLNRGELDHFSFEKRYRRADGKTIWVRLDVAMVRDERDRPEFIVTQATDITESRRMSDQLADREQRLSLALEGGKLGMWDWELASGGISFSRLAARMLGYSEGEVAPTMQAVRDLVHRRDQDRLVEAMTAHLEGRAAIFEVDLRMRRKSGAFIWVKLRGKVTGRNAGDDPVRVTGTMMDVTEWKQLESRLKELATTDELTGVLNRRRGAELLADEIERAQGTGEPLSLILLDIDHFKQINDRFGHEAGDRVLESIAELLQLRLRGSDAASRWGGEEFAVLLPETDLDGAAAFAHDVLRRMDSVRSPSGSPVSASFGVVQWQAGETPSEVLRRADRMMYQAKRAGRSRVEVDIPRAA